MTFDLITPYGKINPHEKNLNANVGMSYQRRSIIVLALTPKVCLMTSCYRVSRHAFFDPF